MLAETELSMAGYSGDKVPAMQKRMIDAVADDSGRAVCGIGEHRAVEHGCGTGTVYSDKDDRSEAGERRCQAVSVQRLSRLLRGGGYDVAGGQDLFVA